MMKNTPKLPERAKKISSITSILENIISSYGYSEIYLPLYEYYDLLSKTAWDFNDENIIRFIDRNTGKSMVLRPDFTPQVCRNVANYLDDYPLPIRLRYKGRIFKNVNTNKGLKSERHQIGLELFGENELFGDIELILIGLKGLFALGFNDFKIVLSDKKFLNLCLSYLETPSSFVNLLKSKQYENIKSYLSKLSIPPELSNLLSELAFSFGDISVLDKLISLANFDEVLLNRLLRIKELYQKLTYFGVSEELIVFDFGEVKGLNYYTGISVDFLNGKSSNSLVSGGRYDSLMEKFGVSMSACGIAFNIEEILLFYNIKESKEKIDYLVVGSENFLKAEELRKKSFKVLWVSDKDNAQDLQKLYSVKNIIK